MGKNGYLSKRQENFQKIYACAIKRAAMVMVKIAVITLNDEFGFAEKRADRTRRRRRCLPRSGTRRQGTRRHTRLTQTPG